MSSYSSDVRSVLSGLLRLDPSARIELGASQRSLESASEGLERENAQFRDELSRWRRSGDVLSGRVEAEVSDMEI